MGSEGDRRRHQQLRLIGDGEPSAAIYEEAELLKIAYGATIVERLTERG